MYVVVIRWPVKGMSRRELCACENRESKCFHLSLLVSSKQIQYENRDRIIGAEVCSSSQMLALLVSKFSMRTRIEVLVLDAGACDWTHCGRARWPVREDVTRRLHEPQRSCPGPCRCPGLQLRPSAQAQVWSGQWPRRPRQPLAVEGWPPQVYSLARKFGHGPTPHLKKRTSRLQPRGGS